MHAAYFAWLLGSDFCTAGCRPEGWACWERAVSKTLVLSLYTGCFIRFHKYPVPIMIHYNESSSYLLQVLWHPLIADLPISNMNVLQAIKYLKAQGRWTLGDRYLLWTLEVFRNSDIPSDHPIMNSLNAKTSWKNKQRKARELHHSQ